MININFNETLEDDDLIKILLPDMIKNIHKKYKGDLIPNSIQLVLNKSRISYHYEININSGDFEVERVESSFDEMLNILTYFIYYMHYVFYKISFQDENGENIIYEPLDNDRQCIIRTIKNIQQKHIRL